MPNIFEGKKVIIVGGDYSYDILFKNRGFEVTHIRDMENADLLCFTGGEDVSPSLYNHSAHSTTWPSPSRDKTEVAIWQAAKGLLKPCVGICRGGQFLNVMNGGVMYQDVTGHRGSHKMTIADTGREILVSSTHHQMMKPNYEAGAKLVGFSREKTRKTLYSIILDQFVDETDFFNNEVIYYPVNHDMCFQPHPEHNMADYKDMKDFFFECVERVMRDAAEDNELKED